MLMVGADITQPETVHISRSTINHTIYDKLLKELYCPIISFWYNDAMTHKWNYQDYINLEYLFHRDADISPAQLHKRDRNILIRHRAAADADSHPSDLELTALWIKERIDHEFPLKENKSPGEIFKDGLAALKVVCVVLGILTGASAGLSFFTYSGNTPVNVFHFLIFFIFSQILLTFFLALSLLIRKLTGTLSVPPFYALFFGKALNKITGIIGRQWNSNLSGTRRDSINQAMGLAKSHGRKYNSLFYWPLFTLSQLFAFFFNGGLLATTLFKISTSDLAFGWQSTLQFSAASLHKLIQIIALPWSWFIPGSIAYPSLAEIEGSRIILKDGIYHLTTKDLVSWWPFLVFCLIFYGLFFRTVSYLGGKYMERNSLQKIKLNTAPCRRLIQRMLTPLLSTQADPEAGNTAPDPTTGSSPFQPSPGDRLFPQIILVPDDIYNLVEIEKLKQILMHQGFEIEELLRFMSDYDSDQKTKEYLQHKSWDKDKGILILMEGWMVPLVDFLTYLQELRAVTSTETIITIALIGRPANTVFTTVSHDNFVIWQKKIAAIGDPCLNIFPLIPDKGEEK